MSTQHDLPMSDSLTLKANAFLGVFYQKHFPHGFNIRTLAQNRGKVTPPPLMEIDTTPMETAQGDSGASPTRKRPRAAEQENSNAGRASQKKRKVTESAASARVNGEWRPVKSLSGRRELGTQLHATCHETVSIVFYVHRKSNAVWFVVSFFGDLIGSR